MTRKPAEANGTIAPLTNVALFAELIERVSNAPRHLPRMASFTGFSGYGKTVSATYGANKTRARYVEVGESWTKAKFCRALLTELGTDTRGTVADMVDRIIETLITSTAPLIIDEFDHVVRRGYIETVREIHDKSNAPIILIGEELLPLTIASKSERFHNRMLDWVAAEPADAHDARVLAGFYCPDLAIDDGLLDLILKTSERRVRRICVNLDRVREFAQTEGLKKISLDTWGDRALFSGLAPKARAV